MTASAPHAALAAQLEDVIRRFDTASRRAEAVAAGLTPEQLVTKPAPGSWSVAECLEHLNLTNRPYVALLTDAWAKARAEGRLGSGPFKPDFMGRLLAWSQSERPRFKFAARPGFKPVDIADPQAVLPEFLAVHEQLKEVVRAGAGVAVDRVRVVSPVDSRVKYNAYAALLLLANHDARHLRQAEEVRRAVAGG